MGWKSYAIPFNALSYDKDKKHLVLNISRERLDSAPVFRKEDLAKQEWANGVYQYYGVQPSWIEKGPSGKMDHPMGGMMEKNGMMEKHRTTENPMQRHPNEY